MTLTKAKVVASAAVDAGFDVRISQVSTDNWVVRVNTTSPLLMTIDVQAAAGLATTQAVTGKLAAIEYT